MPARTSVPTGTAVSIERGRSAGSAASAAPRRGAALTRRGIVFVVVGSAEIIAAYVAGRTELLYVGALALLLPVIAMLFVRLRRVTLTATRSFTPSIVALGQPVTVELRVTNTAPVPTSEFRWRDGKQWDTGGDRTGLVPALAARRTSTVTAANQTVIRYELTPPRRGVFTVGPMRLELSDPFGLALGEITIGGTDQLLVTPRLAALPDTGLAILASEGQSMLVRRAIGGEDDLSTREYRRGDALRRVHWRATARHGELMVRQEEPRSHAEARVILDTRRTGYPDTLPLRSPDDSESQSFELALSLAASLALHLARGGFAVEFVETAATQLAPVHPIEFFLDSLATAELSSETGALAAGSRLSSSARPDRAHGSVFAVLADADNETLERLAAQRPSFDLAVAFIVTYRGMRAVDRLRDAGWTCVPMRVDDSVEGAWRAVAEAHGARHGR